MVAWNSVSFSIEKNGNASLKQAEQYQDSLLFLRKCENSVSKVIHFMWYLLQQIEQLVLWAWFNIFF